MNSLSPECPRCRARDARLLNVRDTFLHDPPEHGEKPISAVAVYFCACGHVFTHVDRADANAAAAPHGCASVPG